MYEDRSSNIPNFKPINTDKLQQLTDSTLDWIDVKECTVNPGSSSTAVENEIIERIVSKYKDRKQAYTNMNKSSDCVAKELYDTIREFRPELDKVCSTQEDKDIVEEMYKTACDSYIQYQALPGVKNG